MNELKIVLAGKCEIRLYSSDGVSQASYYDASEFNKGWQAAVEFVRLQEEIRSAKSLCDKKS